MSAIHATQAFYPGHGYLHPTRARCLIQPTIKADHSCNDSLFSMHMNHSDLSFPSMTQHVQHLPSSMHIVTQHFTALSRMHACGEISQCERLGELGADPSSPPGLQTNNDMHKRTMIQSSLAKAQTAHGCNFRASPFQVFSAGNRGANLL